MCNPIVSRIDRLRSEMKARNICVCVIPTSDFHESEYVGDYFKAREYMTGFTGSAGTAVITLDEAGLWTDARYFLQAEEQLRGSGITLYRMDEEGVPSLRAYLEQKLIQYEDNGTLQQDGTEISSMSQENRRIACDGRVISAAFGQRLEQIAKEHHADLYVQEDLVDLIWEDRPALSCEKVWVLEERYSGESTQSKLGRVRRVMQQRKADLHVLTSLDDICWLLNVRGNDISYVPVVLSYLVMTQDNCLWFVQEEALSEPVQQYLKDNQIEWRPYGEFYDYLSNIQAECTVLLDERVVNYRAYGCMRHTKLCNAKAPSVLFKAIKNEVELWNIRQAHLKDAVAMCRFMYYLKTNIGKIPMTEMSAARYLEELRQQQAGFLELSFETISGYAEHGAIVHYAVTEESDKQLEPEGLLLVDSGGHYLEGTTDITRTFALGPLTDEMRADFTRVCCANLNLAAAHFLQGCTGRNLDLLARQPLWDAKKDYKHGTGHGVGYLLSVHEGPNAFRWRKPSEDREDVELEAGMVTTDEPGIYIAGKYGIRTENELICCKGDKNEYGQMMYFETVTYVPIDLDAIDKNQMTQQEIERLNAYHALVYDKVSPYLQNEELAFLRRYTRPI